MKAMVMDRISAKRAVVSFGALVSALTMAGCELGPLYKKPELTVPVTFRAQLTSAEAVSFADLPWWNVFHDPVLQKLVAEGVANNYDLQVAVARIEQARAMVGQVESEGKPQVGYSAGGVGEKGLVVQDHSVGTATYGAVAGLLNAAWEFDIWGRIRHATEAAKANLLAQEDVRRGVVLTLVSDIATGYFRLLELDREQSIAEESTRVYGKTHELFSARFDAGKDSRLPVERAQAAYNASKAKIEDLKRLIGQQENAISTLVGAYPKSIDRGNPLVQQVTAETPVGSTTALLQRRPDILQAEQNMIRANADIGVAVANFFPRIGLSTFLGGEGIGIGNMWSAVGLWNIALSAAGPIYTGGRLQEEYHEKQAYWDETVAQYKQMVLVAFHETSDALVAQQTLGLRRIALQDQVTALRHSTELASLRYEAGRASYFEVLEAQQQLFPAEDELAQTQRDQLVAVVDLYKALGGGWDAAPPAPQTGSATVPLAATAAPQQSASNTTQAMPPPGDKVK
jgi:multidrug efflux system outer membrane protein